MFNEKDRVEVKLFKFILNNNDYQKTEVANTLNLTQEQEADFRAFITTNILEHLNNPSYAEKVFSQQVSDQIPYSNSDSNTSSSVDLQETDTFKNWVSSILKGNTLLESFNPSSSYCPKCLIL